MNEHQALMLAALVAFGGGWGAGRLWKRWRAKKREAKFQQSLDAAIDRVRTYRPPTR
jgi:hypothetical protein